MNKATHLALVCFAVLALLVVTPTIALVTPSCQGSYYYDQETDRYYQRRLEEVQEQIDQARREGRKEDVKCLLKEHSRIVDEWRQHPYR
jgi:uncharacterized membrane protein (DUF106 family)